MDEENGQNWLTGWRKSSFTLNNDCVELHNGSGLVRDTKNRRGPVLSGSLAGLVTFAKSQ